MEQGGWWSWWRGRLRATVDLSRWRLATGTGGAGRSGCCDWFCGGVPYGTRVVQAVALGMGGMDL